MLNSLSGLGKREAEGVLSSVVQSLLPNPFLEAGKPLEDELHRRVLAESREKLSVALDDESAATRTQLADFLGNQISESVLRGVDIERVRSRLGEDGFLRPDEYEIKMIPELKDFLDVFRLSEVEVFDAVTHPEQIEHLPLLKRQDGSTAGLSFHLKSFGTGRDRYALIVASLRKGVVMELQFAYRAFYSDTDIQSAQSPLGALKKYVNRYGMRFRLAGLLPSDFYAEEVVPLKPGLSDSTEAVMLNYVQPLDEVSDFYTCMLARSIKSLKLVHINFVFMLNLSRLRRDSTTHGITIASQEEIEAKPLLKKIDTATLLRKSTMQHRMLIKKGL